MKKIKLNESVLEMKLNADNRKAFIRVILEDAFKARSEKLRNEIDQLFLKISDATWGSTPQARAANKKATEKLIKDAERLSSKGIKTSLTVGHKDYDLSLNIGGQTFNIYFAERSKENVIAFEAEYLCYHNKYNVQQFGKSKLTMDNSNPLAKEFFRLKDEAEDLEEASIELTTILNTVLGKARTLGAAIDKWPELSMYAPSLLSASKEIMVRTPDLNAKIDALRSGSGSVKDAMKKKAKD